MNGDLSLSKSLGGLRIANPTDDEVRSGESSPATNPTTTVPSASYSSSQRRAVPSSLPAIDASGALDVTSSVGFDPTTYDFNQLPSPGVSPISQRPKSPAEPLIVRRRVSQRTSNHTLDHNRPPVHYPNRSHTSQSRSQAAGFASAAMASQGSPYQDPSYQRIRMDSSQGGNPDIRRSQSQAAAAAAMQRPSGIAERADRTNPNSPSRSTPQAYPTNRPYLPPRRSSRPSPPAQTDNYDLSRAPSQPSPLAKNTATLASNTTESQERGSAANVQQSLDSQGRPRERTIKKGPNDFEFGRTLGEGSYSTVLAATDRESLKEYAIKVLDKRHIIKEKKVKYVNIEKDSLNRLPDHPGIVKLYYTFQNNDSLFYVLDLASGGELLGVLKKTTSFDEECSRFYSAEILDCVEYMHSKGIIHRDLKPENVLLDDNMHVKITDFGTAKILDIPEKRSPGPGSSSFGQVSVTNDPMDGSETDRAVSFVGTAEYVSPELLTDKNACKASDLWAFGCIVYQLLAGRPPFKASNEYQTFQKIVNLDYTFPPGFPPAAKNLVQRLLVLNPADRLPIPAIKAHRFFEGTRWGKGLWSQQPPRLRPHNPNRPEPSPVARSQRMDSAPPPLPSPASKGPVKSATSSSAQSAAAPLRPQPRIITELAPPSQLDIDWSPILNRPNERILKLGNLTVYSVPAPYTPSSRNGSAADVSTNETPSKFSRLFGASATKKRQRLVMVSSAARIILAPSGGDKKEAKQVIDLRDPDVTIKSHQDGKGYTVWNVWTVSSLSLQSWLEKY